jgi:serine/threonine protein kinase
MMDDTRKSSISRKASIDAPKLVKKQVLPSRKYTGTYIFEEKLGKGMQSTVWKFVRDGQVYAAKQTSKTWIYEKAAESMEWVKRRQQSLAREILFLEMIKSPNVVGFVELIMTKNNYYCIIEYANGGSLQNLLNLHTRFPEKIARKILKQIIQGCKAMFDVQVMHRDLKLDNILIHFPDRDNFIKMTD